MISNLNTSRNEDIFSDLLTDDNTEMYAGMSGLSLAFIGDAVYELMIRSYVVSLGEARVQNMHRDAVKLANAGFQSVAAELLLPLLTDEESAIYKRGRNAHSSHTPKNKTEAEYHKATGFEALFGYLFLLKRYNRLKLFFDILTEYENKGDSIEQHK